MKPYGVRGPNIYPDEEGGPPSKHRKMTSKNRKESRRLAHKSERAKVKQSIKKEVDNESRPNGN